jgi:hypothetical protein
MMLLNLWGLRKERTHDFSFRVVEGWRGGYGVCECAAVAGCVI